MWGMWGQDPDFKLSYFLILPNKYKITDEKMVLNGCVISGKVMSLMVITFQGYTQSAMDLV